MRDLVKFGIFCIKRDFCMVHALLCKNKDIFLLEGKIWIKKRSLELLRTLFKKSVIDSTVQLIICV